MKLYIASYNELRALVGNGLLTSEGDVWKRQQRLVQPLFTHRRVASYAGLLAEEGADVVRALETAQCEDGTVDLHGETTRYSLRVVRRALSAPDVEEIIPVLKDNVPYLSVSGYRPL